MGIEFRNVTKTFGGTCVVDDLSLEIGDGEFVVLLGPSGCGKTTTLRMLAGLETVTSGDIFIGGERVNDVPTQHRDLAMVFQSYALYPHMTIAENIGYPLRVRKLDKAERAEAREARRGNAGDRVTARTQTATTIRRRAAARRARACNRARAARVSDGRTALESRCAAARADARRVEASSASTRDHDDLCHARSGRSDDTRIRVAVMKKGRLQQFDTPMNIYNRPANRFVAEFVGSPSMNFIDGKIEAEIFVSDSVTDSCWMSSEARSRDNGHST